jgi:hypothetical protein
MVVEKHRFLAVFWCVYEAALSILKRWQIQDRELEEQCILHSTYIHHFVIGQIFTDLIKPSF